MNAKETIRYLYEYGHIPQTEHCATILGEIKQLQAELQTANEEIGRLKEANKELTQEILRRVDKNVKLIGLRAELDKHRWIPVSERLPEKAGYYQCFRHDNRFPTTREYLGGGEWVSGDTVTHWKPIVLPKDSRAKPE